MEADRIIEQKIKNALKSNSILNPRRIGVSVANDVITLTGIVDNYIEKKMAECVVNKMTGARRLLNRLQVVFSNFSNDNQLKWKALQILSKLESSSLGNASVSVNKGWVTIKGETDNDGLKSTIREKMFGIGAIGVINLIRILEK